MNCQSQLIGSIVYRGEPAMTECVDAGLVADHFDDGYRAVWVAAEKRYAAGKSIDIVTLTSDGCDGTFMEACVGEAVTPSNAKEYARLLLCERRREDAVRHSKAFLAQVEHNQITEVDALIEQYEKSLCDLLQPVADNRTVYRIGMDLLEEWSRPRNKSKDIRWPLESLNQAMAPITDELIYIAGRPSTGKTALALNWCKQLGFYEIATSIASLESKKARLVQRIIAMYGQVNTMRFRRGESTDDEQSQAVNRWQAVQSFPLSIVDNGMNLSQVRSWARSQKAAGTRLLILDNMKHVRGKYDSTVEKFRGLSEGLKWIRDDIGLPFVVLHHLSRDMQLSWSDDIERDADVVMFLTDNEDYSIIPDRSNDFIGRSIIDVEVKKCRDGTRGFTVPVEFVKQYQIFREWEQ